MEIQDFLVFWDDKIIGILCFLYLEIKKSPVSRPACCMLLENPSENLLS